ADFNRDGRADLATANAGAGTASVLLNAGGGQFDPAPELTTGGIPDAIAAGDLNDDGRPDLAVTDLVNNEVNLFIQDAASPTGWSLTVLETGSRPTSVAIGDLNRDGVADLAVSNAGVDDSDTYTLSLFVRDRRTGAYDTTTLDNFADDGLGGPSA